MELGKKEAALIFKENGDIEAFIPEMKDDEVVPHHVLNATVIMELVHDNEEFLDLFNRQLQDMLSRLGDKEECE